MVLPVYPNPMPTRTHTIWKYEKEKSEDKTELFNKLRGFVDKAFDDFEKSADPFNYKPEDFKNKQNAILEIISNLDK